MKNDHDDSERHFALRIQPERNHQPWHAKLEDEMHSELEFVSPLELARFLANVDVNGQEKPRATKGLR